ncbi:MAG: 30S ribosome-binding factor RbfA [Nitrospiria bacterium]
MQGDRIDRVADQLKQEVADVLAKKVRDPRIGFVTVTHADVSRDLRNARIYVCVQAKQNEKQAFNGLKKAGGFVRAELAKRLPLRRIPALTFVPDRATERIAHLLGVLEEVEAEEGALGSHGEAGRNDDPAVKHAV